MRHDDPEVIAALEQAWDESSGVLGLLHNGVYDRELAKSYSALLDSIEVEEGERLHPQFVRALWFAPLFGEWQSASGIERDASRFCGHVRERVMEILGVP